jgi:DNA-binding response OmpR family regulator
VRPLPTKEPLEWGWGPVTDPFTTTVKAAVNRLRATLGDQPIIETVRDTGYRIGGQ